MIVCSKICEIIIDFALFEIFCQCDYCDFFVKYYPCYFYREKVTKRMIKAYLRACNVKTLAAVGVESKFVSTPKSTYRLDVFGSIVYHRSQYVWLPCITSYIASSHLPYIV